MKQDSDSRILMPSLSPTMEEGTVREWLKKEKQKVDPGDVLCVVQTDKANVDFEYQDQGYLAKIAVPVDSNPVKVGGLLGFLVQNEADLDSQNWDQLLKSEISSTPQPMQKTQAPQQKNETVSHQAKRAQIPNSLLLSPAARILFARNNLSDHHIRGSGKHGMITKPDIINFLTSPAPKTESQKQKAKAPPKGDQKVKNYQDKTIDQIRIKQKLEQTQYRRQFATSHLTLSLVISENLKLQEAKSILELKLKSIVSSAFFETPSSFSIEVQEHSSPIRPILPVNCDVLATVTETRIPAVESTGLAFDPFNPNWDVSAQTPKYEARRTLTVNIVVRNEENLSLPKIAEGMWNFKRQLEMIV